MKTQGAICAPIGHGGMTVYYQTVPYGVNATMEERASGLPDRDGPELEAAGVPVWDLRTIDFKDLCHLTIKGPMLAQNGKLSRFCEELPSGFDKVPYAEYIAPYIAAGATRPYQQKEGS